MKKKIAGAAVLAALAVAGTCPSVPAQDIGLTAPQNWNLHTMNESLVSLSTALALYAGPDAGSREFIASGTFSDSGFLLTIDSQMYGRDIQASWTGVYDAATRTSSYSGTGHFGGEPLQITGLATMSEDQRIMLVDQDGSIGLRAPWHWALRGSERGVSVAAGIITEGTGFVVVGVTSALISEVVIALNPGEEPPRPPPPVVPVGYPWPPDYPGSPLYDQFQSYSAANSRTQGTVAATGRAKDRTTAPPRHYPTDIRGAYDAAHGFPTVQYQGLPSPGPVLTFGLASLFAMRRRRP